MAYATEIHTILSGNAPLVALLTGGIYLWTTLGEAGISFKNTPQAYDAARRLKPLMVVKARTANKFGGVADYEEKTQSQRQIVECWFYTDKTGAVSVLASAIGAAFLLLHEEVLASGGHVAWETDLDLPPDRLMLDATCFRSDFEIIGIK